MFDLGTVAEWKLWTVMNLYVVVGKPFLQLLIALNNGKVLLENKK
jgi:hypothetical protein